MKGKQDKLNFTNCRIKSVHKQVNVTHHTKMWDSDQVKDCHLHKADLGSLALHSCEQKAFHLTLERNLRHMMFKTTKICMKGTKEILRETKKEKNNNILCIYYTTKSVQ